MKNRLVVGHFRYGLRADQGVRFDNVGSVLKRLAWYQDDGNLEHLVDAANLLMIEFADPNHPKAHFLAGDDNHEHTEEL